MTPADKRAADTLDQLARARSCRRDALICLMQAAIEQRLAGVA